MGRNTIRDSHIEMFRLIELSRGNQKQIIEYFGAF